MRIASSGRTFYDDGYSDGEDDEKQGLDNELTFPKNRLYGRTKQLAKLKEIYDSLDSSNPKGPPFVVVSGYPGSGKTSLIQNFAKSLKQDVKMQTETPFFFAQGKYDQRQDHPFSAIVHAFDTLFLQIIRDNDSSELEGMRKSIQAVMIGEDLHALTPLIPGLAAFMNHDSLNPQDTDVGARDGAWNQVKYLFQSLLRAISSPATGRRMIFFLDNLDLADESSLDLLSIFVRDKSLQRIMIACSLQSMPGNHHAAKDMLTELEKEKSITKLTVGNLTLEELNQFVGDTLEMEPDKTMPLSKIIFNQTKGNMFFALNFMKEMHRKSVLYFSVIAFCWEWNLEAAGELEAELPNDMLDVIAKTIKEMPPKLQRALMIASYTRSVLCSSTLQSLMQSDDETLTKEEYDEVLNQAMKEGYFERCRTKDDDILYRFAHGQIQQAAMTLIEHGSERNKIKRFIALHLKELWKSPEDNWMLYTAADYLNSIPAEPENSECLARLNLTCGEKSLKIGAFKPASFYLRKGLRALEKTDKPWTNHYELTINMLRMNAKAELFLGNFELSSSLSLQILKHCKTLEDKKPTYLTMSLAKAEQQKYEESIEILLSALGIFTDFPKHLLPLHVLTDIRKVKKYFDSHTDDFFLKLPDMEDPKVKSNMELLQVAAHRAFFTRNTAVFLLCSLRMIRWSIQHGIDSRTASGLAGYAVYLSYTGDQNGAVRIGRLVRQLLGRGFGPRKFGGRAVYLVTMWVEVWTTPLEGVMNSLHRGHKLGMEAGDIEVSTILRVSLFRVVFHGGYPVDAVKKFGEEVINELTLLRADIQRKIMADLILPVNHLFRSVTTSDWEALAVIDFDPTSKNGVIRFIYWCLPRLKTAIFFGNLQFAKELADKLELHKEDSVHMNLINRIAFSSLAYSRSARKTKTDRKKNLKCARRHTARLKKLVHSKGTTPLFLLKLMEADLFACTSNNHDDVQRKYDDAIAIALDTGHIHFAALGSELAGEYFLDAAKERLAEEYLTDSCALYKEWRAFGKVADLFKKYPSILSPENQKSAEFSNLSEAGKHHRRKSADLDRLSSSVQTDAPFVTPEVLSPDSSLHEKGVS